MSFSISAAGTKEQTLASLEGANVNGNVLGDIALTFLKELVGADDTQPDADHTVRYSLSASGHSGGGVGSSSYLSLSLTTSFEPKPAAPTN